MAAQKQDRSAHRFRQLVERSRFDLKLALDVADAEGFDETIISPARRAKACLHECLERLERKQAA
ncbi:MAG TPA: hypothetical protein VHU19_14125 [Pyrinomonadaceae bacterium]|jgi:hypothetical protein|nr:hypothetical protein [Pyrinomonadaceae bacterium]